MVTGNKQEINLILRNYKNDNGSVCFPALFGIRTEERLPSLFKSDAAQIASIISVGLTISFESMNLSRPMNGSQIADLAETILDSSHEDNLALEDVMLFLQKLIRGEYGKLYESMDIPKFMDMFEIYREERWQAINRLHEERQVQYKALPENSRLITLRDLMTVKQTV
jgi:hypothetical protein